MPRDVHALALVPDDMDPEAAFAARRRASTGPSLRGTRPVQTTRFRSHGYAHAWPGPRVGHRALRRGRCRPPPVVAVCGSGRARRHVGEGRQQRQPAHRGVASQLRGLAGDGRVVRRHGRNGVDDLGRGGGPAGPAGAVDHQRRLRVVLRHARGAGARWPDVRGSGRRGCGAARHGAEPRRVAAVLRPGSRRGRVDRARRRAARAVYGHRGHAARVSVPVGRRGVDAGRPPAGRSFPPERDGRRHAARPRRALRDWAPGAGPHAAAGAGRAGRHRAGTVGVESLTRRHTACRRHAADGSHRRRRRGGPVQSSGRCDASVVDCVRQRDRPDDRSSAGAPARRGGAVRARDQPRTSVPHPACGNAARHGCRGGGWNRAGGGSAPRPGGAGSRGNAATGASHGERDVGRARHGPGGRVRTRDDLRGISTDRPAVSRGVAARQRTWCDSGARGRAAC